MTLGVGGAAPRIILLHSHFPPTLLENSSQRENTAFAQRFLRTFCWLVREGAVFLSP